MNRLFHGVTMAVALGCAAALSAIATTHAPGGDALTPPLPEEIYKAPDKPMDPRINAEKVTKLDPPPLPRRIVLPMPPVHRVSERPEQVPIDPELWRKAGDGLNRGIAYLKSQQDSSGGWMRNATAAPTDNPDELSPVTIAVTALAIKAIVQADPKAANDEKVGQALRLVIKAQQPDGSFSGGAMANYVASSVLSALAAVGDQDLHDHLTGASAYLQGIQWDQSEGLSAREDWFGGAGYGANSRPDLSNLQMMLDAMYDAGLSPDEPAFQKALAFVSRTQNLKEANKAGWAGNDGGFVYTPANGGESMASEAAGEGRYGELLPPDQPRSLRSYGSMTYAGFKSMLYAGLAQDDVRVRAAFDWIRNNWTFDENPGLGQQGLYYYYHTMARALLIAQQDEITDVKGVKHNWREALIEALLKRQNADGSWVNPAEGRWMEGEPVLVTIYSALALEEALKPVRE